MGEKQRILLFIHKALVSVALVSVKASTNP